MDEDKQHTARRLVEDHTTDNIDWQTLLESALILALVGMVFWIVGGAR